MKSLWVRTVALGIMCATFVGISGTASAYARFDWRDREIHAAQREISRLRIEKDRALAHRHFDRAREIQREIDVQRDIIRRDRRH